MFQTLNRQINYNKSFIYDIKFSFDYDVIHIKFSKSIDFNIDTCTNSMISVLKKEYRILNYILYLNIILKIF